MSNYYEETMPLETDNDDYLKYFFDESIPLFQRLNTIIKKGRSYSKTSFIIKISIISINRFIQIFNGIYIK